MEKTFCGLLGVIYLLCANAPPLLIGHCPGKVYILLPLWPSCLPTSPLRSVDLYYVLSSDSPV